MNPLLSPGPERVLLAGDWHGNTGWAKSLLISAGQRKIPVLLQLGDFGFWVPGRGTDDFLDQLEETAARNGVVILFVDGNHECFPALYDLPIDLDTGLRPVRPHIFHLPRGLRWSWHGKIWLALGGAVSVDRHMRTEGRSWWPEETLTDTDVARAIAGGPVDVIVSHDAPDGYEIPGLGGGWPQAALYRADLHRAKLGEVVDATRPKTLYHGHYHVRYTAQRGATRIIGLADDGGSWVKSAIELKLDD